MDENFVTFQVSSEGKVLVPPLYRIQTTGEGLLGEDLQGALNKIAPKVAEYIEQLLQDNLRQQKIAIMLRSAQRIADEEGNPEILNFLKKWLSKLV